MQSHETRGPRTSPPQVALRRKFRRSFWCHGHPGGHRVGVASKIHGKEGSVPQQRQTLAGRRWPASVCAKWGKGCGLGVGKQQPPPLARSSRRRLRPHIALSGAWPTVAHRLPRHASILCKWGGGGALGCGSPTRPSGLGGRQGAKGRVRATLHAPRGVRGGERHYQRGEKRKQEAKRASQSKEQGRR